MIGKTISHYRILEKLGEGGMGVVYKAHDTTLDRPVALKFLSPFLTTDPTEKERFYHEARAAAALTHANIAVVYEIGEYEGQLFIAMEYVEGQTLRNLINTMHAAPLPMSKILDIAIQASDGLAAAHEKGIVHRDIKPENIMITPKGQAKITDFGLAKLKGATKLTKAGSTLGTAAYMSPEQVRGEDVDRRTDIFSLGTMLYEMLAGRLPFRGENAAAIMYSIANDQPPPLARYNEQVTDELQHIASKALEKDRDDRYQHVDEFLSDLRREQKRLEYSRTEQVTAMASAVPRVRKWRYPMIILGIVGVAVIIILATVFNPFKRQTEQKQIPGTEEKSIAVLPFVDMSPQKDQEYFCDGLTEELINRLSNIKNLKVPARTSAFVFKGKTEDIREIGEKLKVQTVLEGSVQKSGDKLRITAQLIKIADGYHLWSEKYDRELKDVFSIQDEISSAIVNALQLKLTPQEAQGLSEHPIDNIKAYDCYLKAGRLISRFDEKSIDSALEYLQTAIDIMGDNAELYAGMARAYYMRTNIGIGQEDDLKRAEEYAKKALILKSDLPSALLVLSDLSIYEDYPENLRDEIRYNKKALAANPFATEALSSIAVTYAQVGKPTQALVYAEMYEKHDPLNSWRYVVRGVCYEYDCRFELAMEQFRAFYQADPASPLAQQLYLEALASNGKCDEVLAGIDRMATGSPRNVSVAFNLLLKYALLKDRESAFSLMTPEFQKTCKRDFEWSYIVAARLSLLGAKVEALDWLENAIDRGFINYPFIQCDPLLDNIRGEERFKKLAERAKYEWEHFEVPE